MSDKMPTFAAFSLELRSPLHLGSRRAGVVAQTHRHAPGHLFVHALAAAVGAARGGSPGHFADALDEIMRRFRFGPAFFIDGVFFHSLPTKVPAYLDGADTDSIKELRQSTGGRTFPVATINGDCAVAVEAESWGGVKALFR